MKVVHWAMTNGSGMHRMAEAEVAGERAQGVDAVLINPNAAFDAAAVAGVDVHVIHTHLPDQFLWDGTKKIWVSHGTPEVMIETAYEEAVVSTRYGHGDAVMLMQFWLQNADAIITHWERHHRLLMMLSDRGRTIDLVPMGVDTAFWQPVPSAGKYAGAPSVFTAENQYRIKWNLDLYFAWPLVVAQPGLHQARLHAIYVPRDQHRVWFPLLNRCGCSFFSYVSDTVLGPADLRNAFISSDFYLNLVRYGDHDLTGLQAKACGARVISYRGNPYADYWLTEGSQVTMAEELGAILRGEVAPRETQAVPTLAEMTAGYLAVYERIK